MVWAYVIRSWDRELFKRCRRAWDFSSRERQNYEPIKPLRVFDFDRAIHDALAVYYFPGMWEWNRQIVLPLVIEGFFKSMYRQRDKYIEEQQELSPEEEQDWNDHLKLGENMLKRYFDWASTVDCFSPIQVEPDFEVNIPDPLNPGQDLVAPGSVPIVPIRYRGRIDLLVVDEYNAYWLVDHRIVEKDWEGIDQLLLDEQGISYCWALENFFPGMRIAGVIYNELRKGILTVIDKAEPLRMSQIETYEPSQPESSTLLVEESQKAGSEKDWVVQHRRIYMQAIREPDPVIRQQGNDFFRRTQIPRSRATIENFGRQIVLEAMEMTSPEVRLYPSPSVENCSRCVYRRPCIAMNEGSDIGSILETSYRKRSKREFEEGRIGGSTWSMDRGAMPPKFG